MKKQTSKFVCENCGYESIKWLGRCTSCGKFNSMIETVVEEEQKPHKSAYKSVSEVRLIGEVSSISKERFSTGIPELDNVLGGGVVPASLVLIGGDPGIGKSTLLTEVAAAFGKNEKVLYVSAEESASQVRLRAERLGLPKDAFYITGENQIEEIENITENGDFKTVIIDSIQAVYLNNVNSASGSVSQIRESAAYLMRMAKSKGITVFIVGHVTKDGAIAGPKVLEHIMDTVLYFEGENTNNYRILRAVKNRFGSTNEVGIFEMRENGIYGVTDVNGILLSENRGQVPGSAVTCAIEGTRALTVEIQALVCPTVFGMPRRMSNGVDYNKVALLLAILEKRIGTPLGNQDVYINVMSGIRVNEPSVDLSLICAVYSALKNLPVDKNTVIFGETGLTGEVRSVSDAEKRISEAVKMGFTRAILPYRNAKSLNAKYGDKIQLTGISYVYQAVYGKNNVFNTDIKEE